MIEPKILEEMGRMAELQFSNDEIALIVELDPNEMAVAMEDPDSDIYKKVMGGRLRSEAELRGVIIKLSKQGSSPAQNFLLKLVKERERKDIMK
jgi:hypothetical protein